ncbi:MAG TPA: DUF1697 domain-containing protein [Gaiellaceae bacterium]|nr:DUF1697 domain-containing protein [Gaiellaceae bacterium]
MSANGWVALLRGINVGGKNRVPMAELRTVFEEAGAAGVATYIQSGNVVFVHPANDRAVLGEQLEAAVAKRFGVESAVVLRTFAEIGKVARAKPFGPDNANTHVIFLAQKPPAAAVRSVTSLDMAPDEIKVVGSEAFLHYPNGVSGARIAGAVLGRSLGVGTARNWRTVTQLAAMASAASL